MLERLGPPMGLLLGLAWAHPATAWWGGPYNPWTGYAGAAPWTLVQGWSGLAVEQQPTPQGYLIRIHTGNQGPGDVQLGVSNGQLLVHSGGGQISQPPGSAMSFWQFGGYSQWIGLPADADWGRMGINTQGSLIEVWVPRRP